MALENDSHLFLHNLTVLGRAECRGAKWDEEEMKRARGSGKDASVRLAR
jgi:hypothetical protein